MSISSSLGDVGLVGAVLVMLIIVLHKATVTEAYKQLSVTMTTFSNLFGVRGSNIGKEKALHTTEMSFIKAW